MWKARRRNEVGFLWLGCLHVAFCLSWNENVRGGISRTCHLCHCARGGILKSSGAFRVPFCSEVPPRCPNSLGDPHCSPQHLRAPGLRPGPAGVAAHRWCHRRVWRGPSGTGPDGSPDRSLWNCVWHRGGSRTAWPLLGPGACGRFSAASVWGDLYSRTSRSLVNLSNCCFI